MLDALFVAFRREVAIILADFLAFFHFLVQEAVTTGSSLLSSRESAVKNEHAVGYGFRNNSGEISFYLQKISEV